jgi:hypothetical protein
MESLRAVDCCQGKETVVDCGLPVNKAGVEFEEWRSILL